MGVPGGRCFRCPGKSQYQYRKFTAAMAIPTPKSTPASTRFEPPSPKAKVSPVTTIATKDSPRAIVLVNACCRTLTAFSQGDWPLTCVTERVVTVGLGQRAGRTAQGSDGAESIRLVVARGRATERRQRLVDVESLGIAGRGGPPRSSSPR
jgi:hypothetical protein